MNDKTYLVIRAIVRLPMLVMFIPFMLLTLAFTKKENLDDWKWFWGL